MPEHDSITKIAVIADTHHPLEPALPEPLLETLQQSDLIIHLGDFSDIEAYKAIQKLAPLIAVYGNADDDEVRTLLPDKKRLEIHGYSVGLVHGWGPPKNLEKRVAKVYPDVDLLLFGHSHQPVLIRENNRLLFNPGSATNNRDGTKSYGIIQLGKEIQADIHTIE